jgi:hypothetical protein
LKAPPADAHERINLFLEDTYYGAGGDNEDGAGGDNEDGDGGDNEDGDGGGNNEGGGDNEGGDNEDGDDKEDGDMKVPPNTVPSVNTSLDDFLACAFEEFTARTNNVADC